ncbi:MAG: glycoside hydrolase family 43 protein [Hyphomonas sp.]|nr:glycoside hydrolase family 43 protein [Hyphomonas sp.]MCB9971357.1 glycoside hydrolase family 43 protein [Hyphomonas sp.]
MEWGRIASRTSLTSLMILVACAPSNALPPRLQAEFSGFTYAGHDPVFDGPPLGDGEMWNPILTGFYPDPAITQVGSDYYLVNSTFCYFPGIPVWHSTDLVHWTQIGNVIDRPGMLDFEGLGLSRGVFAPTISHHDGRFYVANTCVDCGGNFIVTAEDPAGPWSDPVWIPDVGGIDPSLFWDTDGKLYLMNNDEPEGGSTYPGHRAIWIREIDQQTFQPVSAPAMIINGGARPQDKPIWIEGPHIYRVGNEYLFSAAEGGTAKGHSQVVFKADKVLGPYTPYPGNPILTQRDLPESREDPITSVGHADFVEDASGNWWASFLGVRPYHDDDYNTGRETFLLPVKWKDGWPVILEPGERVPYRLKRPDLPAETAPSLPTAGNFSVTQEFNGDSLPPGWMTVRVPHGKWYGFRNHALTLNARPVSLGDGGQPSFLARRQQHMNAEATTEVSFAAGSPGDEAGLAAFQNDAFFYSLGLSVNDAGEPVVRLHRRAGDETPRNGQVVAESPVLAPAGGPVSLKIAAHGANYDFFQGDGHGGWAPVALAQDGTLLSTHVAGGFVGTVFGVYAQSLDNEPALQ